MTDGHCCAGRLLSPDGALRLWPSSLGIILFLIPPPSRGYGGAIGMTDGPSWSRRRSTLHAIESVRRRQREETIFLEENRASQLRRRHRRRRHISAPLTLLFLLVSLVCCGGNEAAGDIGRDLEFWPRSSRSSSLAAVRRRHSAPKWPLIERTGNERGRESSCSGVRSRDTFRGVGI